MSESIAIGAKRAALVLAEELSYYRAAKKLKMTTAELQRQIADLEQQLCLFLFQPGSEQVELTDEGRFLIEAFRESVALHDRDH